MIWPAPMVPYFHSQGHFFKAMIGAEGSYQHYFGHTREIEIVNPTCEPVQLHLILDLYLRDSRLSLTIPDLTRLPLLHPFRHDGGFLKYRVISDNSVEILEIKGPLAEGWPYVNYPDRFQPARFDLTDSFPCSREEFDEPMYQGVLPEHLGHFIAVLPDDTNRTPGLWQEDGNVLVNAVFCFNQITRIVETYNECG